MNTGESGFMSSGISPRFVILAWAVIMAICIAGMTLSVLQDGRPDVASAAGAVLSVLFGGLYIRKLKARNR